MAEPTQFSFPMQEIAELAVKKAGLTSGKWSIGVNFMIHVGNMGVPPHNQARPSASVMVDTINLMRVPDGEVVADHMKGLVVDAAELHNSSR